MAADATELAPVHLEPLTMGQDATTPWGFSPLWFLLLALLIPALVWLVCAWKRALDEDPHRLRRRGRRELTRLLAQMGKQGSVPAAAHLHAWMRATARTWNIALSTPTPAQIASALQTHSADAAQHAQWQQLWRSTERGLFAADASPPSEWLQSATTAAAVVSIPKRERWFPNKRRHWLPMLTLLAALLTGVAPRHATAQETLAGDVALPDAADLAPIRQQADQALQLNWNDWAAHYNLAAAYMQQQRWNASVAHGTIAFLQNPASRVAQDNLRFAMTQTQRPDPTLHRLLSGYWYERMATWMSPAQWQRLALFASLVLAAGLTLLVLHMYRPLQRPLLFSARGVIAAGALVLLMSAQGWGTYDRLADPRAAILVQSLEISPEPSDLTPREKSSPALAGSIVQMRRGFLTWQQVQVREDLTGWVRRDTLMPFYAAH
jgi:hypothetical protein